MGDALGKRAGPSFWGARIATALPGPFRAAVDAWLLRPDRGTFDALISSAEAALRDPSDERVPSELAEPTRAAMEGVLSRLASELRGPNQSDLRAQALADGEIWHERFTRAPELSDQAFVLDDDLSAYASALALTVANGVRDWIVANDAKVLADGLGALLRNQELKNPTRDSSRENPKENPVFDRLSSDSRRFLESVGSQFARDDSTPDEPHPLFVSRDLQAQVLSRILSGDTSPLIVVGEAGFGKTSLVWGVARALAHTPSHRPLAVSAAWFPGVARPGEERANSADIIAALTDLDGADPTPVVLLDTADLLLHSSASVIAAQELVEELSDLQVPLVLTVRPAEAEKLTPQIERVTLDRYSPDEMSAAVRALARKYLPAHSSEELVEMIQRARVRQLPVLEVLQSPLLLTMLFDLSHGVAPSMDMDVTSLYRQYWHDRIESDRRDLGTEPSPSDDLTAIACRIALAMVAEGSPDVQIDALMDAVTQVDFQAPLMQPLVALNSLASRGVIVRATDRVRFFHQTLFEFVAAQALLRRPDPVGEANRLLEYVLHEPLDLFIGAVLEQLLVLLSGTMARRDSVATAVRRILASDSPTVTQIGVAVCARQPAFEPQLTAHLDRLPSIALRRFLSLSPQIRDIDVSDVIARIWQARRSDVLHDVIRAIGRIARRDPVGMSELAREINLVGYILSEAPQTLSNATDIYTTLFTLAESDPDLVRRSVLAIFDADPGPESLILLMGFVTDHWNAIGDHAYLTEIYRKVESVLGERNRVPGRSVRNALGALLHQERLRAGADTLDERIIRAHQVLAAVDASTTSFEVGAELVALALEMRRLAPGDDPEPYLDEIFKIRADMGPPQVVGLLVGPLLAEASVVREPLVERIRSVLIEGLPSRDNGRDLTSAQRWAIAARRALLDPRVDPAIAASCLRGVSGTDGLDFWGDPAYGLNILATAATGGHLGARAVIERLVDDPAALDASAQRTFIDTARAYAAEDLLLSRAAISVAISCDALGALQEMAQWPACAGVLAQRHVDLRTCLVKHLEGDDGMQKRAITLWASLQRARVLVPDVDELEAAFRSVRVGLDKSRVVRMMVPVVRASAEQAQLADRWLESLDPTNFGPLIDARIAVRRAILGSHGSDRDWPNLLALSLRPRASGSKVVEPSMMHDASTFIRRTISQGELALASAQFLDIATQATTLPLSGKQRRNLTAVFYGIAVELSLQGEPDVVAALASHVSRITANLAEVIVRAAIGRPTARTVIEQALTNGEMSGDIAQYTAGKLSELPREVGRGPFPAIYRAA
ncbi:hypothetical protein H9651_13270 [Microbacterium sp. Sa4CUA7]|uniref:AAA+ ATPase domain-containing protein n=1 Tax=Microbacterium pullorum TaxID=2762236 RepID=A0ABR8S547_9MICO|nr:hypothetical protein [Microbacterium pullorum]MBD7958611.1 hypothetical protein [Microbacterium pullorum]